MNVTDGWWWLVMVDGSCWWLLTDQDVCWMSVKVYECYWWLMVVGDGWWFLLMASDWSRCLLNVCECWWWWRRWWWWWWCWWWWAAGRTPDNDGCQQPPRLIGLQGHQWVGRTTDGRWEVRRNQGSRIVSSQPWLKVPIWNFNKFWHKMSPPLALVILSLFSPACKSDYHLLKMRYWTRIIRSNICKARSDQTDCCTLSLQEVL